MLLVFKLNLLNIFIHWVTNDLLPFTSLSISATWNASETVGEALNHDERYTAPDLGRFQVLLISHIITYSAAQTAGQNKGWPLIWCICSFVYVALLIIKPCQIIPWEVNTVYIYMAPEHEGCWYFMDTCHCSFPDLALTWNRQHSCL